MSYTMNCFVTEGAELGRKYGFDPDFYRFNHVFCTDFHENARVLGLIFGLLYSGQHNN